MSVCLLGWFSYADVEDVAAPDYQAAKVCGWVSSSVFSCSVQDDVHVAVAVDHFASVFCVILESD